MVSWAEDKDKRDEVEFCLVNDWDEAAIASRVGVPKAEIAVLYTEELGTRSGPKFIPADRDNPELSLMRTLLSAIRARQDGKESGGRRTGELAEGRKQARLETLRTLASAHRSDFVSIEEPDYEWSLTEWGREFLQPSPPAKEKTD